MGLSDRIDTMNNALLVTDRIQYAEDEQCHSVEQRSEGT